MGETLVEEWVREKLRIKGVVGLGDLQDLRAHIDAYGVLALFKEFEDWLLETGQMPR